MSSSTQRRGLMQLDPRGRRIRKALVAAVLLVGSSTASWLLRDPAWDDWWDGYNWGQLFLFAPVLFFSLAVGWQLLRFIVEWCYRKARPKAENPRSEAAGKPRRTLDFWLHDFSCVVALYLMTAAIGDIPMAVYYLSSVRQWHLHWSWWNVADFCVVLMIAASWILDRVERWMRRDLP